MFTRFPTIREPREIDDGRAPLRLRVACFMLSCVMTSAMLSPLFDITGKIMA